MLKQFKEHSHQTIQNIKQQQLKQSKNIVQPRVDGEINPEFLKFHSPNNLNVSRHDVEVMAKKSQAMAKVLDNKRRQDGTTNL